MTDRTVGLLWHSMSSENLGVGALTLGHREIVRAAAAKAGAQVRFKVLGWADPKAPYFTADDVEVRALRSSDFVRLDERGFLAEVRGCDLVLDIGAGDSFSDIYGPSRILKMLAAQNLLRLSGTPYVISPQTIGPFDSAAIRRLAASVLRGAALVTTRDEISAAYAREMGYDGNVLVASDVALRLPFDAPLAQPAGALRVGLNVSGLLFNATTDRFELKSDYRDLSQRAIALFLNKPQTKVVLVSHVLSSDHSEDDRVAALALKREFPEIELAPDFRTPSDAKSFIAGLDFFAGARMHACIAAFSSGVPCVPMAYSRKFSGLFGALGYAHVADLKGQSAREIIARLDRAYEGREDLRRESGLALGRGIARLDRYEDALAALIVRLLPAQSAA